MTAKDIIDQLGGVMQVGRDLGISFTTVSGWARFNQIPEWRQAKLLELAMSKGVTLSTADFPSRDQRINPQDAAA
jgi:hypothetical protein